MDLKYHGANCLSISGRKTRIVFDDNLVNLGLKSIAKEGDIQIFTDQDHVPAHKKAEFVIDTPGEYEISGVSIYGVAVKPHVDDSRQSSVIYRLVIDNIKIAVIGNINPDLSDSQLEEIGSIDVMVVPVGGKGLTVDGTGARELIKDIEPKIAIPIHYAQKSIKYEAPQDELETALKTMSMEVSDTQDGLKLKNIEQSESTKLIVLNPK